MRLLNKGLRLIFTDDKKTCAFRASLFGIVAVLLSTVGRRAQMAKDALDFLDSHANNLAPSELDRNSSLFQLVSNAPKPPAILFSNKYALNLTLNWMCNVDAFNLTERMAVIALDDVTATTISSVWPQAHVFLWHIPAMGTRFTIGTGPYQMFQVLRAKVIAYLAHTGTNFWMLQADTFWGRNLFDEFDVGMNSGDVIFDREGSDGLARMMIAGGNFFVRANPKAGAFFEEVATQLQQLYATDNNIMGSLCSSNFSGVDCGEIPFDLIANWRWHLGERTEIPPLLQFDELGPGKFERMEGLKLKFATHDGVCLESSRNPRLSLEDLLEYPLPKSSSYHVLRISHAFFEFVLYLVPKLEHFLRAYLLPYFAYFLVL